MKYLTSIFLVPILIVSFPCWGVTMEELIIRSNLYYEKFSAVPFSGDLDEELYKGSFQNGKREGPWEAFYQNGQLRFMGNYENGKMEGPWEGYSENGLLHFKGKYKNGKYHGFWEWFNADLLIFIVSNIE